MRTTFRSLLAAFLLLFTASTASALFGLIDVSPAKAKELGITLTAQGHPAEGALVTVELRAAGLFSDFAYIELWVSEGDQQLLTSKVAFTREGDLVRASFSARSEFLRKCTVVVVRGKAPDVAPGLAGYCLHLRDFPVTPK